MGSANPGVDLILNSPALKFRGRGNSQTAAAVAIAVDAVAGGAVLLINRLALRQRLIRTRGGCSFQSEVKTPRTTAKATSLWAFIASDRNANTARKFDAHQESVRSLALAVGARLRRSAGVGTTFKKRHKCAADVACPELDSENDEGGFWSNRFTGQSEVAFVFCCFELFEGSGNGLTRWISILQSALPLKQASG